MDIHDDSDTQFPRLDTPYLKYSSTNYVASGQDVHTITEILHQRQAQLHDVAGELAFVESIMKRVRDVHQQFLDKRDQILVSMRAHQGLVSCIRRLPPEILSEIFVWCLPPETYIEPNTGTAPLLLVGICRGWRKVALGTPRLWCSLSVRPYSGQQESLLLFYHHWLSRARGCLLSLAVDMRQSPNYPVWRDDVTELLQPHTGLTVRLHVNFGKATVPDLLLKDVTMLECFTLKGDLYRNPMAVIIQPEPRLRSLNLQLIELTAAVRSAFQHCWTHITRLEVTLGTKRWRNPDIDGPAPLTLLALCPHLQDFTFSFVDIPSHDVATYAALALTHPNLRSLNVKVVRGTGPLLDALTLPALRCLKIRDMNIGEVGRTMWRQNEFRTFVARSRCPLETLKIHGGNGSPKENQAEYVTLIPTLKHIDLRMVSWE
jgi:hypothetical protein